MLLKFRSVDAGWSPPPDQGTSSSSGVASFVSFPRPCTGTICELSLHRDWFDLLDGENQPILTEREILRNLQAIVTDADDTPPSDVSYLNLAGEDSHDVGTGCPQFNRCPHH